GSHAKTPEFFNPSRAACIRFKRYWRKSGSETSPKARKSSFWAVKSSGLRTCVSSMVLRLRGRCQSHACIQGGHDDTFDLLRFRVVDEDRHDLLGFTQDQFQYV